MQCSGQGSHASSLVPPLSRVHWSKWPSPKHRWNFSNYVFKSVLLSLKSSYLYIYIFSDISSFRYLKSQSSLEKTHHFYNFHHGVNAEMIEECGQVLFHLDAVVVHLGHGEDAHLALPPNLSNTNNTVRILILTVRI